MKSENSSLVMLHTFLHIGARHSDHLHSLNITPDYSLYKWEDVVFT